MIDEDGNLKCNQCGKKLGMHLRGYIEIPCPRCKHFNIFDTEKKGYTSHKLLGLDIVK